MAPIISEVEATGTFQQILRHLDGGFLLQTWATPLDAIAAVILAVPVSLLLWVAITAAIT